MTRPRILIAGIGNIFLGDDAFGVEVVRRLLEQPLPDGVQAVDFGIRGFDLACAILDGYDIVILVDAVSRGGPPGTLYVVAPDLESLSAEPPEPALEGHSLTPEHVLQTVLALGGCVPALRVIGCEPATFGSLEQPAMGLSPVIARAVDPALPLIQSVLDDLQAEMEVGQVRQFDIAREEEHRRDAKGTERQ